MSYWRFNCQYLNYKSKNHKSKNIYTLITENQLIIKFNEIHQNSKINKKQVFLRISSSNFRNNFVELILLIVGI